MGTMIDECIEIWTHPTQYFPSKKDEALYFVKDTMRKYQKIEDIYYHQSGEALENSLSAVIEDGNN